MGMYTGGQSRRLAGIWPNKLSNLWRVGQYYCWERRTMHYDNWARDVILILFGGTFCVGFLTGRITGDQFLSAMIGVLAGAGLTVMAQPRGKDGGK